MHSTVSTGLPHKVLYNTFHGMGLTCFYRFPVFSSSSYLLLWWQHIKHYIDTLDKLWSFTLSMRKRFQSLQLCVTEPPYSLIALTRFNFVTCIRVYLWSPLTLNNFQFLFHISESVVYAKIDRKTCVLLLKIA